MRELNEAQREAVEHFRGPMLVLAGPGSGKTFTITERIKRLVQERQVKAGNILVITFTKAAATEMKQRYLREGGKQGVQFGTFHAIFFTILKYAYHYSANNIIREDMRFQILRELVAESELEIEDENEFLGELAGEISRVKGERIALEHYYSQLCPVEVFRRIFNKYQRTLERKRLLDFDDMLIYCHELLKEREDVRALWQQKYPYILIDEFQDINRVQYDTVRLLAEPENHLFVVGDDDQSIYGFRGAHPDIMQQFLNDYPQAAICRLGINYRSGGNIVAAAERLIAHNKKRFSKKLCAAGDVGEEVVSRIFEKTAEQNICIRNQIAEYRKQGIPYREMAVLFRTNPQARGLTGKLMEYNIPFVLKEHLPNLYEHWIVRDIFIYIKVAAGERERSQVMRIINRPKRYVHRNAFTEPYADLEELKLFYEDKDWMVERIEQLQSDLAMLVTLKPYAAVNFIRKGIGYDEYIREYADYRGIRADDLFEVLDELQEEARAQESMDDWYAYIQEYSEALRQQTKQRDEEEDAVQLLTMHGAKGLEYQVVFIPSVNEGVIPHNKAVLEADLEEERRLFYVAMTRAKKQLYLYAVKEHLHKETEPSRFLEETLH